MLQDQALKTLAALGQTDRTNAYVAMQLAYAAGLIQGAMERLGVPCSVQVDAEFLPICMWRDACSGSDKLTLQVLFMCVCRHSVVADGRG